MGLRESSRFDYINLSINSSGNLYEKSKEPKDGFVEHINEMTGERSGYWKEYYSGLVGYLDYIGLRKFKNSSGIEVTVFSMSFKDYSTNETYVVSFPLVTAKGGIQRYVKSFVKYFKNIDYSRELVLNSFKKKPGDEYAPSNLAISYAGAKEDGKDELIPMYFKKGQNGWPEPTMQMHMGKETASYKEQDDFTYNQLLQYIDEFNKNIQNVRIEVRKHLGLSVNSSQSGNTGGVQQAAQAPQQYGQAAPQPAQTPRANSSYGNIPPNTGFSAQRNVSNVSAPPSFPPQEEDDLPF